MACSQDAGGAGHVRLFLGGDVMTGRGIDQVLPYPSPPDLYERWVQHASDYVTLAERRSGAIPRPVPFHYVWGDALAELERQRPLLRIINLETSVTRSARYQPGKGIHYRMNPANVPCLTAAGIDCCVLANNHVLDWGEQGLLETLDVLRRSGIAVAGAGGDADEAARPAVFAAGRAGGRLLVLACGIASSGIPGAWAAGARQPGVHYLPDCSAAGIDRLAEQIRRQRRDGDLVVVSLHWGGNWGYDIPPQHVAAAHRLVDEAGADLVHGHSSHHPLAIEVYRQRPIIYGCGDLLNDYEGIRGYEAFRSDLAVLYFPVLDARTGALRQFLLTPLQIRRLRLCRCEEHDVDWMAQRLREQGRRFGVGVEVRDGRLRLCW